MEIELLQGECLGLMASMPSNSIDLIATDLPYGTTANKWDFVIEPSRMWQQVKHVLKPGGVFVTTASQPFTSMLVVSNMPWFKAELIWEKEQGTNFFNVKYQPYKVHESILVFSGAAASYTPKGNNMVYNPIMTKGLPYKAQNNNMNGSHVYHTMPQGRKLDNEGERYPRSVIQFNRETGLHPTQKPVALFEYLIKTFSNPGDTVLDLCAGSGTTGIAAVNTGRKAILIELNPAYIELAKQRIAEAS